MRISKLEHPGVHITFSRDQGCMYYILCIIVYIIYICTFILVLFLDLMCLHSTRASLVSSCVRRLRHVRAYVDIALASGY